MGGFLSNIINPVHAEIQAAHAKLSPPAQEAIARAAQPAPLQTEASPVSAVSTQHSLTANPETPPPPQMGMPSPQGMSPMMGMPSPTQTPVTAPRGTVEGDQPKLAQMTASGPGVSQIYHNITNSRFGQAHPLAGKIAGGGLQGLATAAEAAGSMFGPTRNAEAVIPGTTAHHALLEHELERNIAGEEKARTEEAQRQELAARTGLGEAQTANAGHWREQVNAQLAEHGLQMGGDGKIIPIPESQLSPVQQAQIQGLRNPWQKEAGNQPLGDRVGQLNDAMTQRYQLLHKGQPLPQAYMLPANATKNDFDRLDKLMQSEETASATQEQRAESERMRQAMLAIATARLHDTETEHKYRDVLAGNKAAQPFLTVVNRTEDAHEAAKDHTGPSDYEIIMAFVDATKPSSGFRFTNTELQLIRHARSLAQDAEGLYNKAAQGRILTDEQVGQMLTVMDRSAAHAQQNLDRIEKLGGGPQGEGGGAHPQAAPFKIPEGAPAAPKEDNKLLKIDGKTVAKSQGGQWVAP